MMTFLSALSEAKVRLLRKRVFHFVLNVFAVFLSVVLFTGFTPGDECRSGLAAFEKEDYETAVKHFTEGAVEGDQAARMMLGLCYNEGYGVKKDEAKAVRLLQEAAKTDDEIALMTLGMTLRKLDEKDGLEYLKKSADKGCALAQFQVAGWYFEQDEESKALEYFKKAAAHPLTDEKILLDYLPEIRESFQDQTMKINLEVENITNSAIVYSQIMVGSAYKAGLLGLKPNQSEAEKWLGKARENGWDDGSSKSTETNRGASKQAQDDSEYRKGLAALEKKDYETAVKHFTEGTVEGDRNARLMLGYCCDAGLGMKPDNDKTVRILRTAADSGDENAMTFLALVLMGLEEKEEGMSYLKKAADKGCAPAQYMIASLYAVDDSDSNGEKKALEYFSKAAAHPLTDEDTPLDHMSPTMDPITSSFEFILKNFNLTNYSVVASQIMIGTFYEQGIGGLKKDQAKAEEWYGKALKNGWVCDFGKMETAESSSRLDDAGGTVDSAATGTEYEQGAAAFKQKDYMTAVEHFTKSADNGNAEAKLILSYCLSNGFGIRKDEAKSEQMAKAAEKSGDMVVDAVFGSSMYAEGKKQEGLALLKKSADKGCAYAQFVLGGLYSMDDDGKNAVKYYELAAAHPLTDKEIIFDLIPEMSDKLKKQTLRIELENNTVTNIAIVSSQVVLGLAYGNGMWGIEPDREKAKKWCELAGKNGWADASETLKSLGY